MEMLDEAPVLPPIAQSMSLAIEDAAAGIARLDARISVSPVARAWHLRAAWSGYARALQLQGGEIDEIDLFSWGCGLPLPSRPRRPSNLDEFADFQPWLNEIEGSAGPQWRDRLPFSPNLTAGVPRALIALDVLHVHARRDGGIIPWLSLPIVLRGLGMSRSTLPCLVGGAKAFRWRATLPDDILRPVLRALTSAANTGLERLEAMEVDHRRGVKALRDEYRPTALAKLLALIAMRPLLSPQSVASALDLTLGGAGKLLTRAADLKLLVEVTGRRAWRLYLAPDLAVAFGLVAAPRGRPPETQLAPDSDSRMADALDAFDREMAEIEQRLSKFA